MPKDTQQSFLAYYERKGKRTPGPDEHSKELPWTAISSKFGAGGDRKTFCDDAIAHAAQWTGKEEYDPSVYQSVPLGKIE